VDPKVVEDLRKEFREAEQRSRDLVDACRWLARNPQFALYMAHLQERAQTLGSELLAPLETRDAVLPQEYKKGTINGLLLAATLPSVIMQVDDEARQAQSSAEREPVEETER
jgi:hypothetical protein